MITVPELPRSYVAIPPDPTVATVTLKTGDDLQVAISAAKLGDTIMLQPGSVFTGNFTLPVKSGSGWVTIMSGGKLPPQGTRVQPSDASRMAKLVTPNSNPAIWANDVGGPNHYRFIGIEVAQTTDPCWNLVLINVPDLTKSEGIPSDIIIDRCYIHGSPTSETIRGIWLGGERLAVVDSYISDIHSTFQEAQTIMSLGGPGPYRVTNNYLEAAGENMLWGAFENIIIPQSAIPCDIEIRGNYVFKPLTWKALQVAHEGWVAQPVGPEPPRPWTVKNLLEFKGAKRVVVEANIFENTWPHAQNGTAILFTPRTGGATGCPWVEVSDITIRNNIVRGAFTGFSAGGVDNFCTDPKVCVQSKNILIENNLLYDLDSIYGTYGWFGVFARYAGLTLNHNTVVNKNPDGPLSTTLWFGDASINMLGLTVTNNISKGGMQTDGMGGQGALAAIAPGAVVAGGLLVGASAKDYDTFPPNGFPATWDDVGFKDLANSDYHLVPSSPYKAKGSDGKDPGADMDVLTTATAGVLTGMWSTPIPPVSSADTLFKQIEDALLTLRTLGGTAAAFQQVENDLLALRKSMASDTPFLTGFASKLLRNDFGSFAGMTFTVGPNQITVTSLGRIFVAGNSGVHVVKLVNAATGADVPGGSVSISMAGGVAGQFKYAQLAVPVTLQPGTAYHLVSQESVGGDRWYETGPVTPTGVATVKSSVWLNGQVYVEAGAPNTSYGPLNLTYHKVN